MNEIIIFSNCARRQLRIEGYSRDELKKLHHLIVKSFYDFHYRFCIFDQVELSGYKEPYNDVIYVYYIGEVIRDGYARQ